MTTRTHLHDGLPKEVARKVRRLLQLRVVAQRLGGGYVVAQLVQQVDDAAQAWMSIGKGIEVGPISAGPAEGS